jgi:hypothetical protein
MGLESDNHALKQRLDQIEALLAKQPQLSAEPQKN